MQKMAMIRTFEVVMKTHYVANGIFPPRSASFLEIQKYSLLMYHRKEWEIKKKEGERKKKNKKCLNSSKDKVKHHAGVLLGVFALNNAKTFRRCLLSLGACGRVKCDIT